MNPNIWGPHAWIFLHSIILSYPNCPTTEDKKNIKSFFMNLGNILPCHECRNNYKKHLQKYELTDEILSSKKKLILWLINIHNEVNLKTNKKIYSYEKAVERYTGGANKVNKLYKTLIIILVVILIVYLYYNKNLSSL